jgi:anthranilate synthase component 2
VTVYRNDEFNIDEIEFDKILLSPSPRYRRSGLLKDIIRKYGATKSILGVCLGQQAIGGSLWRNTI